MLNICFGYHGDWVRNITNVIDRAIFKFQFSDLHLVDFSDFDCVVPLLESDYDALRNNRVFFGTKFWVAPPNVVDICNDKLAFNRWLLGSEFAELVPPLRKKSGGQFPYVIKKRRDLWGQNSFIVRNSEDERAMAAMLLSPEYFCQNYISGPAEFALHILMVNGEVVYDQTVKHNMGRDFYILGKDGKAERSIYLPKSEHIAIFSRLLATLDYTGTCCIDYKIENGLPKLMEINPRYGGSLTGDINRYLEAYLSSLGVIDKKVFRRGGILNIVRIQRFLQLLNGSMALRNW